MPFVPPRARANAFAAVNPNHPLARQLVGCWLFDGAGTPRDLSPLRQSVLSTSGVGWTAGRTADRTAALAGAADNSFTFTRNGNNWFTDVSQPFSVFQVVRPTNFTQIRTAFNVGEWSDTNGGLYFGTVAATGVLAMWGPDWSPVCTGTTALTAGVWSAVGVAQTSVTSRTFVKDGILTTNATSIGTNSIGTTQPLVVGCGRSNGGSEANQMWVGAIERCYVWAPRVLKSADLVALCADPDCILVGGPAPKRVKAQAAAAVSYFDMAVAPAAPPPIARMISF